MYVFTQPIRCEQDVTHGQFLGEVQLVCIQSFDCFSKNPVCPTITLSRRRRERFMPFIRALERS